MDRLDYQQQEAESERMQAILSVLTRVQERCGESIALYLASELGLSKEYRQSNPKRKVA
jgi:hypothetical protein